MRIVSTYHVFSHTVDEPGHIAAGIEFLTKGVYQFDQQHPTLTRIAVGLGPRLIGVRPPAPRMPGDDWMFSEARRVLYGSNQYWRALSMARLGNLPFFWIGCLVVYAWGKRYFGAATGVLAVFLLSFFPPLLGHAGLATTDMGCAAMMGAVFLAGCVLLEEPSRRHAVVFGLSGGLAILSKFSVLAFFPATAALALGGYLLVERPPVRRVLQAGKTMAPLLAISTAIASLVVWAGYGFSLAHGVPAPELWAGIQDVIRHNAQGHPSYLLGEITREGFWDFFPIVIAVKTPIPLLVLAGGGIWLAVRNRLRSPAWLPAAYAGAILAVGMCSRISLGLRHILPLYLGLSVLGAVAVTHAWSAASSRWVPSTVAVLLLWLGGSSLLSHPDYLAYFNALAGSKPEDIVVDSDLDWGQDVNRLGLRLQALGAHQLTFFPTDDYDFNRQPGFQGIAVNQTMSWAVPSAGWNAVGVKGLKEYRLGLFRRHPEQKLWPNLIPPRERVGKSILLWYFAPGGGIPTVPFGAGPETVGQGIR